MLKRHVILNHLGLFIQGAVVEALQHDPRAFQDGSYRVVVNGDGIEVQAFGGCNGMLSMDNWVPYQASEDDDGAIKDAINLISDKVRETKDSQVSEGPTFEFFTGVHFTIRCTREGDNRQIRMLSVETTSIQIQVAPIYKPRFEQQHLGALEAQVAATILVNANTEETRLIPGVYMLYRGDVGLSYFKDYNEANNLHLAYGLRATDSAPADVTEWPFVDEHAHARFDEILNGLYPQPEFEGLIGFHIHLDYADKVNLRGPSIKVTSEFQPVSLSFPGDSRVEVNIDPEDPEPERTRELLGAAIPQRMAPGGLGGGSF